MKRALQVLFSCYAEFAHAAINGSTLLRLYTSSDSDPDTKWGRLIEGCGPKLQQRARLF